MDLLHGMKLCALMGTGRAVGAGSRVKTGTAPCVHSRGTPGDGYVVALFPAEHPTLALLLRAHGVPGAEAAKTAGRLLQAVQRPK